MSENLLGVGSRGEGTADLHRASNVDVLMYTKYVYAYVVRLSMDISICSQQPLLIPFITQHEFPLSYAVYKMN